MNRYLFSFFILLSAVTNAQVFDMIISKTDAGAYRTIQSAINKIPDNRVQPFRVFIKNGIYNEKVSLPVSKTNVCFIGENADSVIITYNDHVGEGGITSAANSYTFLAEGNDIYVENITFQNSAGNVGQAVAIRTTGERQVFKNCRFLGFQDTYYAHKNRQYNVNCYIEGATDFIFGDATAVFENCTINCVNGGQYITAPADTKLTSSNTDFPTFYHGLLFKNSVITASSDVSASSYYLGRPWQPNASSVFVSCILGNHIKPQGWSTWDGTNHLTGFYGEYRNRNKNDELIDTSLRVDWSHQLDSSDVANYYSQSYFFKKAGVEWNPVPKTIALGAPVISGEGFKLTWDTVPGSKGYVILRNNLVIGYSDTSSFSDTLADPSIKNTYTVKSVAYYGNLSQPSNEYLVAASGVNLFRENSFFVNISYGFLKVSEPVSLEIYNISGQLIFSGQSIENISINQFKSEIYILKAVNKSGDLLTKKVVF